jgi:hypothetical protein
LHRYYPTEEEVRNVTREQLNAHEQTFKNLPNFDSSGPEQVDNWEERFHAVCKEMYKAELHNPGYEVDAFNEIKDFIRSAITMAEERGRKYHDGIITEARSQASSQVIKKIREWHNKQRKWADNMPPLFGNQVTGYLSALSDLVDFVNELEK